MAAWARGQGEVGLDAAGDAVGVLVVEGVLRGVTVDPEPGGDERRR
ncbi:hypothetical protein [Streptomyces sp. DH8]|nr:hypothetical protein [Streptomyces sp. DH8]